MVQPGDYERLLDELPNVVTRFMVDYDDWNHSDFLSGKDAHTLVYPYVLELMKKYSLSWKYIWCDV